MNELKIKASQLINNSEIPEIFKPIMLQLLEKFGYQWLCDLEKCEVRLGSGNQAYSVSVFDFQDDQQSKELQEATEKLNEAIRMFVERNGNPPEDPLDGFALFVENVEFIDWEDEYDTELSLKQRILGDWRDERIDYYRSFLNYKLADSREFADKDMESIDIGRSQEACRTCGVIFYDNLDKHVGVRSLYCSKTCETKANLVCIYCSTEYTVGKGVARIRIMKLSGFCSESCLTLFKDDVDADKKYISGMRRTAEKFGVPFDPSITRREVFRRGEEKCAICGQHTHLEKGEDYDPLLATVDHIVPWTRGGQHIWDNVQLCCLRCNIVKGNRI